MGQLQERFKHYRVPQKFMEDDVYPYFRAIEGKQGTEVEMGGHKVLMFGSNAYTGLTGDQRIIDAAKAALDKYGSGCAGSRFLNGTLDLHVQLEKEISEFIGKDDCLCFSTGFSVNQGVIPALLSKDDYRHLRRPRPRLYRRRTPSGLCQAAALQAQRHGRPGARAAASAP